MKKNVILLSVILIGFALISNATVWRLNNIPGVDADFTTNLQDAIDNVSSGDTIYVEQSPFSYGGATITKQVILIGGGCWLTENDSTQASEETSRIDYLKFDAGSEGSIVSGLYFSSTYNPPITPYYCIHIYTDNIKVERNYIFMALLNWQSGRPIFIEGNRNDIIIQQNWINFDKEISIDACIQINGDTGNLKIQNNFIRSYLHPSNLGISIKASTASSSGNFQVTNNVIYGAVETYDAIYINNILIFGSFNNGSGGVAAHNICNETQFPDLNNNQLNVDMSTVFVDYDLYIDNGYILAPDSPAIGAGANGGDCGMFSSDYDGNPYILSGMPAIPAIYEIDFNSTFFPSDENILEVNLKAKSHN